MRAYHNYIIERAQSENHPHLALLEQGALDSGLQSMGDFKISCEHYEALAKRSGLELVKREKIGPLDNDVVGGIYVYVFRSLTSARDAEGEGK